MFTKQHLKLAHTYNYSTPMHLISNVYKFTCSCNMNITNIGMTT